MGVATKEELLAEIERLNQRIKDMEDEAAKRDAQARTGRIGWNISTPNPNYTGRTAGVWFENGHAFLPEELPNAQKILRTLVHDFGYSSTKVSDGQEIRPAKAEDKRSMSEKLMQPQMMGVK